MSDELSPRFNADVVRASLEEPELVVENYLFHGRLLSIEEWLPFLERMEALEATRLAVPEGDRAAQRRFLKLEHDFRSDYLRAVFPKRLRKFWAPDPVHLYLRQPYAVVSEGFGHFFTLQASAMRLREGESSSNDSKRTDGNNSAASMTAPLASANVSN